MTKRIINKILHHPTVELKKMSDSGVESVSTEKISLIRDLFGIDKNDHKEENT